MRRRDFVGMAAAALPLSAARIDINTIKSRGSRKVTIAYQSPHSKPNGLQATPEGLWVQDQGASPEHVTLINFADGKVIRDFTADIVGASGVTVDDDGVMWLTSTHNSLIVSCNPQDGKTIAKYWTPGAGRIYAMKGDPPAARSPLTSPFPPPPGRGQGGGQGRGDAARGGAPELADAQEVVAVAVDLPDNWRSMRRMALAALALMESNTAMGFSISPTPQPGTST